MKLTYDPKYNIAYIHLRDTPAQVDTIQVSDELNIDIAPDGKVYGIELLNANAQLAGDEAGRLVVINQGSGESAEVKLDLAAAAGTTHTG
jgi:uncharacterized protein YuzE